MWHLTELYIRGGIEDNSKIIFSSAVFEENIEVLSFLCHRRRQRRRSAKTLTFSNISVITEGIYLKPRVVVHYQEGNPYQ